MLVKFKDRIGISSTHNLLRGKFATFRTRLVF